MGNELDDELETVNIGDTEDQGQGDDDSSSGSQDDGQSQGEKEDRGDDFVPTDDVDGDGESTTTDEKQGTGDGGDANDQDETKDDDSPSSNVPFQRLNEVSRTKSAATKIADGLIDGTIDAEIIKDYGGAAAVAKAIANQELSIDDLKIGSRSATTGSAASTADDNRNPESASWDIDSKFVEYQELVDSGEIKEAASLLRQINKEERRRERAHEEHIEMAKQVDSFAAQLVIDYPILNDVKSREHRMVAALADKFQISEKVDRITALKKAVADVFPEGKPSGDISENKEEITGKTQQQIMQERKAAQLKKNSQATIQQPPPLSAGATPAGGGIDVSKMSDSQFRNLSEDDKRKARGDFI